jgi:hypothetical protein
MQLFALLNFQHVMGYIFCSWLFMIVFGVGLAYSHLHSRDAELRKKEIINRFVDGVEDRNAPYPLVMILIIAGAVLWGFLYILIHGLLKVKI